MDREYLKDYEQKEGNELSRVYKKIREGKFSFEKDRSPPDKRFVKLQKPVAVASHDITHIRNFWIQVPFSGSLILCLPPYPKAKFERIFFEVSEIPKIINFIKETGRLQIGLSTYPPLYAGLDYLDAFFKELEPPVLLLAPLSLFFGEKEIQKSTDTFYTLGKVKYLEEMSQFYGPRLFPAMMFADEGTYNSLKLRHYEIAEDIENLMIDDPGGAHNLLHICRNFLDHPFRSLLSPNITNFTLKEIGEVDSLSVHHRPDDIRFPYEIGKFLMKEKLTQAPLGLDACKELIYNYEAYDLQKIQKSLNEAILTNHPDIASKNADELSEILDNIWDDSTIPKRVKNLRRGIPMSIAAIGSAVSAFTGGLEGFLAGLGFGVGAKFLDVEIEGLSERIAKFFSRNYQANVYDFKKKYKDRIRAE